MSGVRSAGNARHMKTTSNFLVMLTTLWAGCANPTAENCPDSPGVFVATYEYQDGSCSPDVRVGYGLRVEPDDHGKVTRVDMRVADRITTELAFRGCTLSVTQVVTAEGVRQLEVAGDLEVEDETKLSGLMTRVEYMPDGSIACHGVYKAEYMRDDIVVGSAVGQSQSVR